MPVKDGYEVCQFIKTHSELSKIPVVLMSGVVNRAVAERAFAVKADELLRKPFQPQDLDRARQASAQEQWRSCSHTCRGSECGGCAQQYFFGSSISADAAAFCSRHSCASAATRRSGCCACSAAPAMPLPITATAAVPMPQPVAVASACSDSGCSACAAMGCQPAAQAQMETVLPRPQKQRRSMMPAN